MPPLIIAKTMIPVVIQYAIDLVRAFMTRFSFLSSAPFLIAMTDEGLAIRPATDQVGHSGSFRGMSKSGRVGRHKARHR